MFSRLISTTGFSHALQYSQPLGRAGPDHPFRGGMIGVAAFPHAVPDGQADISLSSVDRLVAQKFGTLIGLGRFRRL
jgi:hypothetical protein